MLYSFNLIFSYKLTGGKENGARCDLGLSIDVDLPTCPGSSCCCCWTNGLVVVVTTTGASCRRADTGGAWDTLTSPTGDTPVWDASGSSRTTSSSPTRMTQQVHHWFLVQWERVWLWYCYTWQDSRCTKPVSCFSLHRISLDSKIYSLYIEISNF